MKAAQRFMRPVKEIREGFFTMDDDTSLLGSTADSSSALGPHAVSATRHFEQQYSSRAAEAGIVSSRTLSSLLSTPRSGLPGLASRSGSISNHKLSLSKPSPRSMNAASESLRSGVSGADLGQTADLRGAASLQQHQPV